MVFVTAGYDHLLMPLNPKKGYTCSYVWGIDTLIFPFMVGGDDTVRMDWNMRVT